MFEVMRRRVLPMLLVIAMMVGNLPVTMLTVEAAPGDQVQITIDNRMENVIITDLAGNPLGTKFDAIEGDSWEFYFEVQNDETHAIDKAVNEIKINGVTGALLYNDGAGKPYYRYLVGSSGGLKFEDNDAADPLAKELAQEPVPQTVSIDNQIANTKLFDSAGNPFGNSFEAMVGDTMNFYLEAAEGYVADTSVTSIELDDGSGAINTAIKKDGMGRPYVSYTVISAITSLKLNSSTFAVAVTNPTAHKVTITTVAGIELISDVSSDVLPGSIYMMEADTYRLTVKLTDGYEFDGFAVDPTGAGASAANVNIVGNHTEYKVIEISNVTDAINLAFTGIAGKPGIVKHQVTIGAIEGIDLESNFAGDSLPGVIEMTESGYYQFTVNLEEGYEFDSFDVTVTGVGDGKAEIIGSTSTTRVIKISEVIDNIGVSFSGVVKTAAIPKTFNVQIPEPNSGVIFSGASIIQGGDDYTLTATVSEGYSLEGLRVMCNGILLAATDAGSGTYTYEVKNVKEDLKFTTEGTTKALTYDVLFGNNVKGAIITDEAGVQITKLENISYGKVITFVVRPEKEGTTLPVLDTKDQNNNVVITYEYLNGAIYYHYRVTEESKLEVGAVGEVVDTVSNEVMIYVPQGLKVTTNTGVVIEADTAGKAEAVDVLYGENLTFTVEILYGDIQKIASTGLKVTSDVGSIDTLQSNVQYVLQNVIQKTSVAISGVETTARTLTFIKGEGISVTDSSNVELTIVNDVKEKDYYEFTIKPTAGYELDLATLKADGAILVSKTKEEATGIVYIGEENAVVNIAGTKATLNSQEFKVYLPQNQAGISFDGDLVVTGGDDYQLTATLSDGYSIEGLTVKCNGQIINPTESAGVYTYEVKSAERDLVFTTEGAAKLLTYDVLFGNNVEGAIITDEVGNQITKLTGVSHGQTVTFVVRPKQEGTKLPAIIKTQDQDLTDINAYQYLDGAIYYHYTVIDETKIAVGEVDDVVSRIENDVIIHVPAGLKVILNDVAMTTIDATTASKQETVSVPYGESLAISIIVGDTANYKIAEAGLQVTSNVGAIETKQVNAEYVLNDVKQSTSVAINGVETLNRTLTFATGEGIEVKDVTDTAVTIVTTAKEGDYYEFTILPTTGFELDVENLRVEGEGAFLTSVSTTKATGVVVVGKKDVMVTVTGTKPALETLIFKVSMPENKDGVIYEGNLTAKGGETYELTATVEDGYAIKGVTIRCNGNVVPAIDNGDGTYTYRIDKVTEDLIFTASGEPQRLYYDILFDNNLADTTVTDEVGNDISHMKRIEYGSTVTFHLKAIGLGLTLPAKEDIEIKAIDSDGAMEEIKSFNTVAGEYVITYKVTKDVTIDIHSAETVRIDRNTVKTFVQPGLTATFSDVSVDDGATVEAKELSGAVALQTVGSIAYGEDLNITVELDTDNYKYAAAGIVVSLNDGSYEVVELSANTSFVVKNVEGPITVSIVGAEKLNDYSINLPSILAAAFEYAKDGSNMDITSVKEGEPYQFTVTTNANYSNSIVEVEANLPLRVVSTIGDTVTYKIEKMTEDVVVTAKVQDYVVVKDDENALEDFTLTTVDEDVTSENQQSLSSNQSLYVPTKTSVTYTVRINDVSTFGNSLPNITYTDAVETDKAVRLAKVAEGVYTFTITTMGNVVIDMGDKLTVNDYTVVADDYNPRLSDVAIQVGGVALNSTNNTVEHGGKFIFTLDVATAYDIDKLVVEANGVEIKRTPSDTYVIANITENQVISIYNLDKKTNKVTFLSDSQGIRYTDLAGNEITSADVAYGEDYTFKIARDSNYLSSKVALRDSLTGVLVENIDGTYTIGAVEEARTVTMASMDKVVVYLPLDILENAVTPYYLDMYDDQSSNVTVQGLSTENHKLTFFVKSGKRFMLDVEVPVGYNKSVVDATFNGEAMDKYKQGFVANQDGEEECGRYYFFSKGAVAGESSVNVSNIEMNSYNVSLLKPDNKGVYTTNGAVNFNGITGITLNQVAGYNKDKVEYNNGYKFSITKDVAYTQSALKVTVGRRKVISSGESTVEWTTVIAPDANGVYTIPDIKENRYLKVEGVKKNTYSVTHQAVTGIKLNPTYNHATKSYYDRNRIVHGEEYKFTVALDKKYSTSPFVLSVDKRVLTPDRNGVYTISNITSIKRIEIKGVRLNVEIISDKAALAPGQSTRVEVINVPKGSSVKLHNDTPSLAILDESGNLLALKGGKVKLIAITRENGKEVYTTKTITVSKKYHNKDTGTIRVGKLNYQIIKKATSKKTGQVMVGLNRNNSKLPAHLVIPEFITIKGKKYAVTKIGTGAFYGVGKLKSVSIPRRVTHIESSAFTGCKNLTKFTVDKKNRYFKGRGPMLLGSAKLIAYPSAKGKVTIGTTKDGISIIGAYALSSTRVTELVIGRNVKSIDVCAFSHTKRLKKLTFNSKNTKAIKCSCILDGTNGSVKIYVPKASHKDYQNVLRNGTTLLKSLRIYKK